MSWLSFAARKWFSAAVTIARRRNGRAWNVRHTKFPNLIRAFRPMKKPTTCHFFCVQIEIDHLPARDECPDCKGSGDFELQSTSLHLVLACFGLQWPNRSREIQAGSASR